MERIIAFYDDPIVGEVVLKWESSRGLVMTINGGLQFAGKDEYRYHQTLFLLPALLKKGNLSVLVLGGGDGLGVRELLRLERVKKVKVVDVSFFITEFLAKHSPLAQLNLNSLKSPRVEVEIADGKEFVKKDSEKYDLIVLDYPDPYPEKDQVNDLFTSEHFAGVKERLAEGGLVSLQATSVIHSPNVFRKIQLEIAEVFSYYQPIRVNVPSFGDIGIILASDSPIELDKAELIEGVWFTKDSLKALTTFHSDELPTLPDEKIKETDLADLVRYDLTTRWEDTVEEAVELYLEQIKTAEGKDG